jgi:hypothetical protein
LPEENDKQTIDMKTKETNLEQDYDRKAPSLKDITRPCRSLIANLSDVDVSNRPCFSLFAGDGSQSSGKGS